MLGLAGGLSLMLSAALVLHARGDTALGVVPDVAAGPVLATVGEALPPAPAPADRSSPSSGVTPVSAAFVPDRISIPKLAVTASIVAMSVGPDRSLGVPDDPAVLGWWRDGARPGSPVGSVVIDGHVDSARSGPGALFGLRSLEPGDAITVTGRGDTARYVVAARRQFAKAALPSSVFDQQVTGRLVLITCGGRFDPRSRHYADNVVVFARPA